MPSRRKKVLSMGSLEAYLRSIDIQLDAQSPGRISHFMPTEKSTRLIASLLGEEPDRTFIVVAPYGSGKSLAASYALHLIENRPESQEVLRDVAGRISEVDSRLAAFAASRGRSKTARGLGVPLSGPVGELHLAVRDGVLEALGRFKLGRQAQPLKQIRVERPEDLLPFLNKAQAKVQELGFDRITILWDEFGKHLEYLVQEGRTSQLFHVQKLAEYAARAQMPFSFAVFLHMGLLHYAGSLSQSARSEWRKIEGRFQTIDYVDDSKQLYSLLARLVLLKRKTKEASAEYIEYWTNVCRDNHLFRDFEEDELNTVIAAVYPVTPPALYMLPRLTGRIAQNERTLFHFLEHWDGVSPVSPGDLYDYFEPQMKADITTGGTHRQWLESHSALQKVAGDENSEAVLKTAALFGLGMHGRAGNASLKLIKQAWRSSVTAKEDAEGLVVKELIDRKLLLYRPYKDEVSVWHGSDLDLRSHLESEKTRRGSSFDLEEFLGEHAPPSHWRPLSYNSEYYIRRYFSGAFVPVTKFRDSHATGVVESERRGDGHIAFVLPESREELSEVSALAKSVRDDRLVIAVPQAPVPLAAAALEVHCLYKMQEDQDLIASDPLVLDEIRSLTSDAEAHLHTLIRRCTVPDEKGPVWYRNGRKRVLQSSEDLREHLSDICREIYSKTPKLNNELINKRSPSSVVINSRKKLMLGILERDGTHDLGLPTTTPDGSMFRTLLVNTGVYRPGLKGVWGYAGIAGDGINDAGLRAVWRRIVAFVTVPGGGPKPLSSLLLELEAPPMGVRPGVIPIYLAAAIKAHGGATALRRNDMLVEDLLPTVIEDMVKFSDEFSFEPIELNKTKKHIIEDFLCVFGSMEKRQKPEGLLSQAGEFLIEWRQSLPWCSRTRDFNVDGLNAFRDALFTATDTVAFFAVVLPDLIAEMNLGRSKQKAVFEAWQKTLESADSIYYERIALSLRRHLDLSDSDDLVKIATSRASMFPEAFLSSLSNKKGGHFLRRLRMNYKTEDQLCRSVAQLLTEKRLQEFDDRTMEVFLRELEQIGIDIDNAAGLTDGASFGPELKSWVVTNRRARISKLYNDLVRLVGPEKADGFVQGLVKTKARQAT